MKKLLSKLYILGFMVLTVFFMLIIWNVTFGHLVDVNHLRKRVEEILKTQEEQEKENGEASFKEALKILGMSTYFL